jgi:selenide,water dikinase
MATLNKVAAGLMLDLGVHSCTDITGFGLAGHASHLVQEGNLGLEFDFKAIPFFPEVMDLLQKEICPGGLGRNRDFYSPRLEFAGDIPRHQRDILFDPQTSGGLLIALAAGEAQRLVEQLRDRGNTGAAVIGRVIEQPEHKIIVK